MAEHFDRGEVFDHRVGAAGHAPPEVLDQRRAYYAPPVDVYALGITLYFAQFGRYLFVTDEAAARGVSTVTWPETCSNRKCSAVNVYFAQSTAFLATCFV